jgi:hypothetical protein
LLNFSSKNSSPVCTSSFISRAGAAISDIAINGCWRNLIIIQQQQRYPGSGYDVLFIDGIYSNGNFTGLPSVLVCPGLQGRCLIYCDRLVIWRRTFGRVIPVGGIINLGIRCVACNFDLLTGVKCAWRWRKRRRCHLLHRCRLQRYRRKVQIKGT